MKHNLSLDQELDILQRDSFAYFSKESNPANGLILDKNAKDWPCSIAAVGFALTCYPIAVERGFLSRKEAASLSLNTLRFFWNSPQSDAPDATGYKGFYYHFLDMKTGRRAVQCELSTLDTTFLIAGMLTVGLFFDAQNKEESEIRFLSDSLYRRVDWQWAENNSTAVSMGWTPEKGFLANYWRGYDEALLLYILGLGSPTYPLGPESFKAWSKTYKWESLYGYDYLYTGSLFAHQFSHMWIDFRNIQDAYMQEKQSDYFENSRRATYVQQQYAIHNPLEFEGYGKNCWGITASDGPGPAELVVKGIKRKFYDYIARSVPNGPDDGTIAPWAAIASLPFAPDIVMPLIEHYIFTLKLKEGNIYGFTSTFNQTFPKKSEHQCGWMSPWHFGINQGPIVMMTENYRSGLLWKIMKNCPYLVTGLKRAGFSGGWLA